MVCQMVDTRIARVLKIPHESIETTDDNMERPAEAEASLAVGHDGRRMRARATLADLARKVLDALRRAAEGDGDVLALFELFEQGVTARHELRTRLDWEDYRYKTSAGASGRRRISGPLLRPARRSPVARATRVPSPAHNGSPFAPPLSRPHSPYPSTQPVAFTQNQYRFRRAK